MNRSMCWRAAGFAAAVALALCGRPAYAEAWSFGVMSDTQWAPSGDRPDKGVPGEIIDDVNKQFVKAGVKFVIQVGDITQNGAKASGLDELDIRARHNAALTAAGIRYYALRGNHDGIRDLCPRFLADFPEQPGTPGFRATDGFGGGSSPTLAGLAGLTYAFTYRNATFVLLDQFPLSDGTEKGKAYPIGEQQPWITEQFAKAQAAGRHAFVFGHKNLLGQQHKDNLFGSPVDKNDPGESNPANQPAEIAFLSAMQQYGVHYYMSGHDHQYYRSIVTSPDPGHSFHAQEIITGSLSYKFYDPKAPYSANDQPLIQQRNAVGYCIVTVDGPQVTFNYYSVITDVALSDRRGEISEWKPTSDWSLRDSFGYSLNGKEFLIKAGASFGAVHDSVARGGAFDGTAMAILSGTNDTAGTTLDSDLASRRPLSNLVTTGWSPRPAGAFHSDVLSLRGMRCGLGSPKTSPYVLSLTCDEASGAAGRLTLQSRIPGGTWLNSVELNSAGKAKFVAGPYKTGYQLGTYGFDTATHRAWAVLDHEGDFVVAGPGAAH